MALQEKRCRMDEIEQAVDRVLEQDFDQVDYGELSPESYDFDDLFFAWQDLETTLDDSQYLRRLAGVLGYNSLEYFFQDNPGAVEAIEAFVMKSGSHVPGWRDKLFNEIQELGGTLPEPMQ